MKVVFLGDVNDKLGMFSLETGLEALKREFSPDVVIANCENVTNGLGLDKENADKLIKLGIDVITLGNHTWSNKKIYDIIGDENYKIIRPANYGKSNPGKGYDIFEFNEKKIAIAVFQGQEGVFNILGKETLPPCDNPFLIGDEVYDKVKHADFIFFEIHTESTMEKKAFAYYFDGRVDAVIGTHTHVLTDDACVLPKGTLYLTDSGMCGSFDSVIGIEKNIIIKQFLTRIPQKLFGEDKGPAQINGVFLDFDKKIVKTIKKILD